MKVAGQIRKMLTENGNPVQYTLPLGSDFIPLNELVGRHIELEYLSEIQCVNCGSVTKKSFAQGFCYRCFISVPQTDACILRPELCQAHEGISRDMEWAKDNCLKDHFVYLAISSGLKVGVTRSTQVPTRWIDQGAWKAIRLAQTPNRHLAGLIEVSLKKHLSDRTNWQRMLKNQLAENINLLEEKRRVSKLIPIDLQAYITDNEEIMEITYPVLEYPKKVKSLSFDKIPLVAGKLTGIKGQYLIFDKQFVFNVRKHGGYIAELRV